MERKWEDWNLEKMGTGKRSTRGKKVGRLELGDGGGEEKYRGKDETQER